jgi:hypothetical protein
MSLLPVMLYRWLRYHRGPRAAELLIALVGFIHLIRAATYKWMLIWINHPTSQTLLDSSHYRADRAAEWCAATSAMFQNTVLASATLAVSLLLLVRDRLAPAQRKAALLLLWLALYQALNRWPESESLAYLLLSSNPGRPGDAWIDLRTTVYWVFGREFWIYLLWSFPAILLIRSLRLQKRNRWSWTWYERLGMAAVLVDGVAWAAGQWLFDLSTAHPWMYGAVRYVSLVLAASCAGLVVEAQSRRRAIVREGASSLRDGSGAGSF